MALELEDPGFDGVVLSEFRTRLVEHHAEHLLLDTMLTLVREQGLLKTRGRQRTDATHVLAAIHVVSRLVLVAETLRHEVNELAEVAPDWLRALSPADWFTRYATRIDDYRLPKGKAEREALAQVIGADGLLLLPAVYHPDAPVIVRSIEAVTTLRHVWIQQYYAPEDDDIGRPSVRWRNETDLPSAALRIHSSYDPDARHAVKGELNWVGYKAHLTEACDKDLPHLMSHVVTTPASTHDREVVEPIHTALQHRGLLPTEHLLDAGYVDTELTVQSEQDFGVKLIGPVLPDRSWQAKAEPRFALANFTVDWDAQTVTCPQGQTSVGWQTTHTSRREPVIHVRFAKQTCSSCPMREHCVKSPGKAHNLSLRPQVEYEALQQARQRQKTHEWKQQYAARGGIEGTISQGVRRCDLRRARYIGLARTRLQHILIAVALNLVRLYAPFTQQPRVHVRRSKFAALAQGAP